MLTDRFPEIFLRTLRFVIQDPMREASSREPRSGSRKTGSSAGKPRSTSDVVGQAVCVALDSANVEGASSLPRATFFSAPRASLHAFSHAPSNTVLRAPLGSLALTLFAHVSLLGPYRRLA